MLVIVVESLCGGVVLLFPAAAAADDGDVEVITREESNSVEKYEEDVFLVSY